MAKKQATKVEASYEADVKALFESNRTSLDIAYPRCATGAMSYIRAKAAGDMLWKAQADMNAECVPNKSGKTFGSLPQLQEAQREYDDAVYLAERRAEDTDENKVYDTKVERTREWLDRMEMQHYGTQMRVDAAQMLCDYLADKE
jgi:hypothetical protein